MGWFSDSQFKECYVPIGLDRVLGMNSGNPGGSLSGAIPAAIDTLNSKPFKMALGVISPALWKSEWSPIIHYVFLFLATPINPMYHGIWAWLALSRGRRAGEGGPCHALSIGVFHGFDPSFWSNFWRIRMNLG